MCLYVCVDKCQSSEATSKLMQSIYLDLIELRAPLLVPLSASLTCTSLLPYLNLLPQSQGHPLHNLGLRIACRKRRLRILI
jgi:hypothetical protein